MTFFFAVIFAMVIAQQLLTISDQMAATSREISIRSQEEAIANNTAQILSSAIALADGTFSIDYAIAGISDPKASGTQSCDITITPAAGPYTPSTITISYPNATAPDKIVATASFYRQPGILISASPKCGGTITISKP